MDTTERSARPAWALLGALIGVWLVPGSAVGQEPRPADAVAVGSAGSYALEFTPVGGASVAGPVRVLGPPDLEERARSGTLRSLRIELPAGELRDALDRAARSRRSDAAGGRGTLRSSDGRTIMKVEVPNLKLTASVADAGPWRAELRISSVAVERLAETDAGRRTSAQHNESDLQFTSRWLERTREARVALETFPSAAEIDGLPAELRGPAARTRVALVGLAEGDPDRPIIVGRLYNGYTSAVEELRAALARSDARARVARCPASGEIATATCLGRLLRALPRR